MPSGQRGSSYILFLPIHAAADYTALLSVPADDAARFDETLGYRGVR